jgi:tetratricopeptide (TPR) repeat protein
MPKQNVLTRSKKKKALALLQANYLVEARRLFEDICTADRSDAEAWQLLGAVCGMLGDYAAAESGLRQALRLQPSPETHYYLGNTLMAQNRLDEAVAAFQAALRLQPQLAEAHCNLGDALQNQGRYHEAENCYRKAIGLRPDLIGAHINLGLALFAQKKLDETVACCQKLLHAHPGLAEVHYNLGNAYTELFRFNEAIASYREAIRLKPDFAMAHNNLALALYRSGHYTAAIAHHREALRLAPAVAGLHNNYAMTLNALGRFEEAEREYREALRLDPQFADCHYNLGVLSLLHGNFTVGWAHYRHRPSAPPRPAPDALSMDMHGRNVLLEQDQGLGDELFFLRFAPQLKARGARIAYRPNPKITSLLARLDCIERLVGEGEEPPINDLNFSIGDLPLVLGMSEPGQIPPPLPLPALPERVAAMRARLATLGPPPYLGVTWRAGTRGNERAHYKESPVAEIAAVLKDLLATVLVLQRKPEAGEIEAFSEVLGRPAHDLSALNDDLEDMLALLALLDDYVSVSNTNMHLMAGLGKTARVLVPHPPEWRWMAQGKESPWFRGFKVYRQGQNGAWGEAFGELAQDMKRIFGGTESVQP